jgi:hypothetical protein
LKKLDEKTFLEVFDGVPQAEISMEDLNVGLDMIAALAAKTNFLASNSDARRELKQNSISLNKEKVGEDKIITKEDLINNQFLLLQKGKKNYYLIHAVKLFNVRGFKDYEKYVKDEITDIIFLPLEFKDYINKDKQEVFIKLNEGENVQYKNVEVIIGFSKNEKFVSISKSLRKKLNIKLDDIIKLTIEKKMHSNVIIIENR